MNVTSPDISILKIPVNFDLSSATPVIRLTNESVGANLAAVKLAFELYDPNSVLIHLGNFTTPDALGNFVDYTFPEAFPTFDNTLLWSGGPYRLVVKAKDSAGTIFTYSPEQRARVCPPGGNKLAGKHYGASSFLIEVDCNSAEAKIRDTTDYTYQALLGELISKTITIIPPADQEGNVPVPTVYSGLSAVLHPLTSSGRGFAAVGKAIYKYDLSGNGTVFVTIGYIRHQVFHVNCNYDLCPLLSEFGKLLNKAATECNSADDRLIKELTPMMLQLVMAKIQASCGFDIGKMIEDIKALAGWDCLCYNGGNGINSVGTNIGGNLNFQFDVAGDVTASADVTGNNILIHVKDYSYIFKVCDDEPGSAAFTVVPSTVGRVKTFCLKVNITTLAGQVLTEIKNNSTLQNFFNTIVLPGSQLQLNVDGKCVITTNGTCNYTLTKQAPGTEGLLTSIKVDGVVYPINVAYSAAAGTTDILAKLNSLGLGTFTAVFTPGVSLVISSANNTHNIESLGWSSLTVDTQTVIQFSLAKDCTGNVVQNANVIVQGIINYLCAINTKQIKLGDPISLCYLDATGAIKTTIYSGTLHEYLDAQAKAFCNAITNLIKPAALDCATIKKVFSSTDPITPVDVLYGSRTGNCGPWSVEDLFKTILTFVKTTNSTEIRNLWCGAISICGTTTDPVCNPPGYADAALVFELGTANFKVETVSGVTSLKWIEGSVSGALLPLGANITFVQVDKVSGLPVTPTALEHTILMPNGQNTINNVFTGFPAIPSTDTWKIDNVSYAAGRSILVVRITNNGAVSYQIAYRVAGSSSALSYVTVPAQAGTLTSVAYDVTPNKYEVFVRSVCQSSTSAAIQVLTQKCADMGAFNVYRNTTTNTFEVTYTGAPGVSKVNLVVNYPNGGVYNTIVNVTVPGLISLPIPAGNYGTYVFKMRSVCNEATGYYGDFTEVINIVVPLVVSECTGEVIDLAAVSNEGDTVQFGWTNPAGTSSTIITYRLQGATEWKLPGGGGVTGTYNSTSLYTLAGLPAGDYEIRVARVCANGQLSAGSIIVVSVAGGSTPPTSGTMTIQITAADTTLLGISPAFFTVDAGSYPMQAGDPDITGIKGAYTGNIGINIDVTGCDLQIWKNGILTSTVPLVVGMNTVAINVLATDNLLFILVDNGGSGPAPFTAYWGFKDTSAALTQSEIELGSSGTFADGAQVNANYISNPDPKYLWVGIPAAQPLKTKWYVSVLNNGNIGTPDDLFGAPVTVGSYKFYITNYPTAITEAVVQFRNS
jgi:hypothetical protein